MKSQFQNQVQMSSSIAALIDCGETQRKLFFRNFLSHNRIGEMICVNDEERGDTIIFERWMVNGIAFVAAFCLLSEESMVVSDINIQYRSHEELLTIKTEQQRELYNKFLAKLEQEGTSIEKVKKQLMEKGEETSHLDFKPYTRDLLEERLPAGKKTIMGDRNSTIEVLERQKEVPSDLQRPRLNRYILTPSESIQLLQEIASDEDLKEWEEKNLVQTPKELDLSTPLPFLKHLIYIHPTIYYFPDKEALIGH